MFLVSSGFEHRFSRLLPMFAMNFIFREFREFRHTAARIWFQFVERVFRNHIDEWLLTRAPTGGDL